MFQEANLIAINYVPDEIKKGTMFLIKAGIDLQIHVADKDIPQYMMDEYIRDYGYPVQLAIIDDGNPNIPNSTKMFATHEQIGWFDEGEWSDELSDIKLSQLNRIFAGYDGRCMIELEEGEDGNFFPVLYENKVTICYPDAYDSDDWDDDEGPEYDSAGFTEDDEYEIDFDEHFDNEND